jgi:sporulation protein YlmC with PRC-barrel domain
MALFFSKDVINKTGGFMRTFEKNYEADNRTGMNQEGPDANRPLERLTATSIVGDKVENAQGEDLGSIDNLMINLQTGRVEYAVIEYGSVLGIGGKLFAIPFDELKVIPGRHVFLVNRDKDYLKMSPGFDKNHWPDTNDHTYYGDVNSYWGYPITPQP